MSGFLCCVGSVVELDLGGQRQERNLRDKVQARPLVLGEDSEKTTKSRLPRVGATLSMTAIYTINMHFRDSRAASHAGIVPDEWQRENEPTRSSPASKPRLYPPTSSLPLKCTSTAQPMETIAVPGHRGDAVAQRQ